MNLSKNFQLIEFIRSQTAERLGINNTPSPVVMNNLRTLCETLEQIRELLDRPIQITSGYRSIELNRKVGGASTSAHLSGFAADFTCDSFGTPKEIVKKILDSNIKFDQLICEGTWVHISVDPKMRQVAMNATFIKGRAIYSPFTA